MKTRNESRKPNFMTVPVPAPTPAPLFAPALAPVLAATITLGSSSPALVPAPAAVISVSSSSPPASQGNSRGAQKGKETLRKKRTISKPKTTKAQPKKASKKAPAQKKLKTLSGKYIPLIFYLLNCHSYIPSETYATGSGWTGRTDKTIVCLMPTGMA